MQNKPVHEIYLERLHHMAEQSRRELHSLMPHRGEAGRITEEIIRGVLERILPKRFSLGTGVIINSLGKASAQTDIVIYDNFFNSPLLSEFGANLFPVECVYATIEVKSVLSLAELKKAIADIQLLRQVGQERHYIVDGKRQSSSVPPRSYVVGFRHSGLGRNYGAFKNCLAAILDERDAHVHGVCLLNKNWFALRKPYAKPAVLLGKQGDALTQLYRSILQGQDNFAVYPMDVGRYLGAMQ